MDAEDIALTAAENLGQLDGHEGWRPVAADQHAVAHQRGISNAYIEVVDRETGETGQVYLYARRKPTGPPVFDDGAAADRAHDAAVADELGAL
ncbi:hypothetical protein [Rhodococcus sp. UNC363MFTsu5.1]|uniref:hypothetical protein n=1 Tax=Rhodococcus sp. UNC363MFTsu5.1 TaxID=1449069 RepID=UPI0004833CFD|nr:hypothetical protein [Rhodococcus sp. UNC363MFTsu5.1]